ncbi:MAG: hypothetical protein RLZZ320_545 [Actinomycetota bacterium]|jgi:phosphate transport system substrate-binding protein
MKTSKKLVIAALTAVAVASSSSMASAATLRAAGASSVQTFFDKCKAAYVAKTGDEMPYNGQGSGSGKTAIGNGTVDLAFSDDENKNAVKPADMIHIPFAAWPVAVMANLPNSRQLNLSTETIAKIFAGQITKWNDPAIVADANKTYKVPVYKKKNGETVLDKNGAPVVLRFKNVRTYYTLPNKDIVVIYRNASSGTSANFTTALNKLHPSIWTKAGNGTFTTAFPGTLTSSFRGGSNSTAIAQLAKDTKYSITYNEVSYARDYNLRTINVINPAGNAVAPATEGVLAAFSIADIREDGVVTFNYTSTQPSQYPFSATTYAMVLTKYSSASLAKSIRDFVEFHAFECPAVSNIGFSEITKASELGKVITKQVARIGN